MPPTTAPTTGRGLPAVRIGVLAGLTGILCCVGPTALALTVAIATYAVLYGVTTWLGTFA